MTLYELVTTGNGSFYILGDNSTQAEEFLQECLRKTDYGFADDRIVIKINIIASEPKPSLQNKEYPNIGGKYSNLLIIDNWKKE